MIITITDKYHAALEHLAGAERPTTDIQNRIAHDTAQQPAGFIVVDQDTMTRIVTMLAGTNHVAITEGIS